MLIYPYDNVIGSFWFMPTIFIIFVAAAYTARLLPGRWLPLLVCLSPVAYVPWPVTPALAFASGCLRAVGGLPLGAGPQAGAGRQACGLFPLALTPLVHMRDGL